jgi:hypothetical protein
MILMVMGMVLVLLWMRRPVPIYLYYLLFLTTGVYFAARSQAPRGTGQPSPLYLPRGTIRWLLVVGLIGVVGFAIARNPAGYFTEPLLKDREVREAPERLTEAMLILPLVILGAFLLGVFINVISKKLLAGPEGLPPWYQDIQASLSVLAVLGLGAQVILELVVFPSMESPPTLPQLQLILSAAVAFYFGARV